MKCKSVFISKQNLCELHVEIQTDTHTYIVIGIYTIVPVRVCVCLPGMVWY